MLMGLVLSPVCDRIMADLIQPLLDGEHTSTVLDTFMLEQSYASQTFKGIIFDIFR
jgi:hypothetical protein